MARKKCPKAEAIEICHTIEPKTVIVVTDGDRRAVKAIALAARKLGMYVVNSSAGAPTRAEVEEVEREIDKAPNSVVIVMADDGGMVGEGAGERLVKALHEHGMVNAVVAAASDTPGVRKIVVLESITERGMMTKHAVDKYGRRKRSNMLAGDTAEVLADLDIPAIGIGDPGKVNADRRGARCMERALSKAVELGRKNPPVVRKTCVSHGTGTGG